MTSSGWPPGAYYYPGLNVPLAQPLLLIVWAVLARAQGLTCKPLEGLPLSQPYPPPYFQEPPLPSCSQYTCSCCNRTHSLAIRRSLAAAQRDPSFSRACLAWLTRLACRVCHPEVGVGLMPAVCSSACDAWLSACRDEFFTFETHAPSAFEPLRLLPCAHSASASASSGGGGSDGSGSEGGGGGGSGDGGAAGPLLCSRLGDVAASGEELCREAGFTVASNRGAGGSEAAGGAACFDGGFAPFSTEHCARPPPPSVSASAQRRRTTSGGARGGGAGGQYQEGVSPPVYFLAVAVMASLAWLGYTTVTQIQARENERLQQEMRQLHWRQMRGRAD